VVTRHFVADLRKLKLARPGEGVDGDGRCSLSPRQSETPSSALLPFTFKQLHGAERFSGQLKAEAEVSKREAIGKIQGSRQLIAQT